MPWLEYNSSLENRLSGSKGSYVVFYLLEHGKEIYIPRFGVIQFPPGIFAYTGSAQGSGGLAARIRRHLKEEKPKHWHIDWLRPHAKIIGVYYMITSENLECEWAYRLLSGLNGQVYTKGFGSSDCQRKCQSHLIFLPNHNQLEDFSSIISSEFKQA